MGKPKDLVSSENTASPSCAPAAAETPHIPSPSLMIRGHHPQHSPQRKKKKTKNNLSPAHLRKSFVHALCSATNPHHHFFSLSSHPSICLTRGKYQDSPSSTEKAEAPAALISNLQTSCLPESKTVPQASPSEQGAVFQKVQT